MPCEVFGVLFVSGIAGMILGMATMVISVFVYPISKAWDVFTIGIIVAGVFTIVALVSWVPFFMMCGGST